MWKLTRISFLLVFSPLFAHAEVYSLKQAIEYAIEHSPELDTAKRQQEIAGLQKEMVTSQFLPSLDVTANHGLAHSNAGNPPSDPWVSGISLTAKETLYDNGISLLQYDQAKLDRDYATLFTTRTRDQLCLDVTSNYYTYSLNRQARDITAEQLKVLEKQFLSVSDMHQQGLKTRADFLRLKTQVQRGRLDLLGADTLVASSLLELNRLMGMGEVDAAKISFAPLTPEQLPIETSPSPLDPETTYDFKIAQIRAKSTRFNIDIAKRNYWPQVSLIGGGNYGYANYLGGGGNFGGSQTGWNVMLSLSYNIFDWGLRRHQIETKEAAQLIQENTTSQTKLSVRAQLENLKLNFKQLSANFELSKELLSLEKENYTLVRASYQEGKLQYLDLITSLNNLFSAKQSYLSSVFGIAQTVAKYRFYEGTLYAQAK